MRKNWNDWTRGRRATMYPLLEDLKRGIHTWAKAGDIALKAASACQDPEDEVQHSSKTYRVYLEEDIYEGLYNTKVSKGALWVQISDWFKDILVALGVLSPEAAQARPTTVRSQGKSATGSELFG